MTDITGTRDADTLSGSTADDIIQGSDGNDLLRGLLGADIILGGYGDDTILGNDDGLATAGEGPNTLLGEGGNDTITGGQNNDLISGGSGNDVIDGGEGFDILTLSGSLSDFLVREVTAATDSAPAVYEITDRRSPSPEGRDTFKNIEAVRFSNDGEVSVATLLARAPTDLLLSRVLPGGLSVRENAAKGAVLAALNPVDPDFGDKLTLSLVDSSGRAADADGRFAIVGDRLVVAKAGAFDTDVTGSHSVTVRVQDGNGNTFHKTLTIAVTDEATVFTALTANLPAAATDIRIWDHDAGSLVLTWTVRTGDRDSVFARKVDAGGGTIVETGPNGPIEPDRLVSAATDADPLRLLGVDDAGIAAFVQEGDANGLDILTWVDTATGRTVRTLSLSQTSTSSGSSIGGTAPPQSSSFASSLVDVLGYDFDDGFVSFIERSEQSSSRSYTTVTDRGPFGLSYGSGSSASSSSKERVRFESAGSNVIATSFLNSSSSSAFDSPAGGGQSRGSSTDTSAGIGLYDITEAGALVFARTTGTSNYVFSTGVTQSTSSTEIAGDVSAGLSTGISLVDTAILDTKRFAYVDYGATRLKDGSPSFQAVFSVAGKTIRVEIGTDADHVGGQMIEALGTDAYILSYQQAVTGGSVVRARIFSQDGTPTTDLITLPDGARITVRDDGSAIAYTTRTENGTVVLEARALSAGSLKITPLGGAFADKDGDGDLDFAGRVLLGHTNGELESLRLEGGTYETTEKTLRVKDATVFAQIGEKTTQALFKGSFTIDRNTGVASELTIGTLGTSEEQLKIAGLQPSIKGFTVRQDGVAFTGTFSLPNVLFSGATIDLGPTNGFLINRTGPEFEGFEIPIGSFNAGATVGDAQKDFIFFDLFKAEAKNLKLRYDGVTEELAFSGELAVKSDLVDGLGAAAGLSDITMTFKDLKIRKGLVDFEGEIAAKTEWALANGLKVRDFKLGLKIDDDVVVAVSAQASLTLPFVAVTGVSFAAQFLNPPLSLNKLALTAELNVPIGAQGLFLDKLGGSIDNFAPSPPEPTSLPTVFGGLLGIGWGPKAPLSAIPAVFGLGPFTDKRPVNIELTATTDFSTTIAGTGKLNLFDDSVFVMKGAITYDWPKTTLTMAGSLDALSGVMVGTMAGRLSATALTASASVALAIPTNSLFGPISGLQLASSNGFLQINNDGDATNDFLAAWNQIAVPVIGGLIVGLRLNLDSGAVTPILGANDLPKTNSFDVLGGEDWLMISAGWENAASGPVATRVRTPENTFIQEADYAANGITILTDLTNATTKTIVIDDPRAGNWDLQIIDGTGFGTIKYHGYSPNPPVAVTLDAATLAPGDILGHATFTVTGADPGTDVTLWADTDGAGFDGFALGAFTVGADGAATVDFDARLVTGGSYHLYAVADDGIGIPAFDYGPLLTVAHRPTDIAVTARLAPESGGAARVPSGALPGSVVATLLALNPDATETTTFTLLNDAGGRFTIVGDAIAIGTGAPVDPDAGIHAITIRATTSRGIAYDETVTVEVGPGAPFVLSGVTGTQDRLIGSEAEDVVHGVEPGDIVVGRGGSDVLYLDGARADFSLVLDRTGTLAGPVYALADGVPTPFDPAPPYLLVTDLRAPSAAPLIASSIEALQFRDERTTLAALFNRPPVAIDDRAQDGTGAEILFAEDTSALVDVLANDTDPDGDALSIVPGSLAATNGSASVDLATGRLLFTPRPDVSGVATVTYRVGDGFTQSNEATLSLTYLAVNDAPRAAADAYETGFGETLVVPASAGLLANDADTENDALAAILATGPAHGSLVLAPDGGFTYQPQSGFSGQDVFTYRPGDASLLGNVATVSVTTRAAPRFEITSASAREGDGGIAPIVFTLTRSGDVSRAAMVTYAVAGSGAAPASAADFAGGTLPLGTIAFAPGETARSFSLGIADDTVGEGPETFSVMVMGSVAGREVVVTSGTGTILDDDTQPSIPGPPGEPPVDPDPAHPTAKPSLFGTVAYDASGIPGKLVALYEGLLGRAPDPVGIEFWQEALSRGASLPEVAAGILGSSEYSGAHGPVSDETDAGIVAELYGLLLGRPPEPDGSVFWLDALAHGTSRAQMASDLALSPENLSEDGSFLSKGVFVPDPFATDVARLYYGILDRAPDAPGLQFWTGAVKSGSSKSDVAEEFLSSLEYAAGRGPLPGNASFLAGLYEGALGRAPDAAGAAAWQAALDTGSPRATVAVAISDSPEANVYHLARIEAGWHVV